MFIENVTYNYLLALDTNVPESYGFQLLASLRIVVCPKLNCGTSTILSRTLNNSGKLSLVPYTKDFGRITHF